MGVLYGYKEPYEGKVYREPYEGSEVYMSIGSLMRVVSFRGEYREPNEGSEL